MIYSVLVFRNRDYKIVDKSRIDSLKRNGMKLENYNNLDDLLKASDRELIPTLQLDIDSKPAYRYKSDKFSPKLSLNDIRRLIDNPPKYQYEHQFIEEAILKLNQLGVQIILTDEISNQISAEWIPSYQFLIINEKLISSGTLIFSNVLNHELIHVSQSCFNGSISSSPKLIGLKLIDSEESSHYLSKEVYDDFSIEMRQIESEAYSYQSNLEIGLSLLNKFCG